MLHVCPETNAVRHLLPFFLVLPYGFLTLFDERLDTILLDLRLTVDTEHLLDFQLYRKAVGIPARLKLDVLALHGMVSRDYVLNDTGLNMSDVRLSVCCRRAVIQCKIRSSVLFRADGLLLDVIFFPEGQHFLLAIDKLHIRRYFFIHSKTSSSLKAPVIITYEVIS